MWIVKVGKKSEHQLFCYTFLYAKVTETEKNQKQNLEFSTYFKIKCIIMLFWRLLRLLLRQKYEKSIGSVKKVGEKSVNFFISKAIHGDYFDCLVTIKCCYIILITHT